MATLSTLAMFDDIRRCQTVLTDGVSEEEFLRFVQFQEEARQLWVSVAQEAQRLQRELDNALRNMVDLESKLFHARRLLEIENKARREAEKDRDQIEKRMIAVRDLLKNEVDLKEETKDKFAFLNSYPKKRKSGAINSEDKCHDINSTGSFLSDLSLTQSEDDFLDIKPSKSWKKHRPSVPGDAGIYVGGRKSRKSSDGQQRSYSNKTIEIGLSDKIVAQTKVSIPPAGGGPITAESKIEAIPQMQSENKENEVRSPKRNTSPKRTTPVKMTFPPSAPPLTDHSNIKNTPLMEFKKTLLRSHNYAAKTFLKSDVCAYCQKKIRFGSVALKCRDCRVCVHSDCKELLSVACVPQSAGTPTIKGAMGLLEDYAPVMGPRVPGLIVHCVNEIETRGLNEIGIYRVSGSEREVKALKERFLRGKGIPFLGNVDVHVLCGCIKDFLRSLREPLIPTSLWKNFSNAAQNTSKDEARSEMYRAIDRLPTANRDTLALLIQHFQRIANCAEIKMPIENIARVFGPTIVGYSSAEPDQHAIYTETIIQYAVMESLMKIPTDFWSKFVDVDLEKEDGFPEKEISTPRSAFYGTPLSNTVKKQRKFYGTPPYTLRKK